MRILAVETSTLAGGAAIVDGERLLGEYTLNIRTTHSERLMAAVDRLLQDCGWELGDLEGVAVAIGPGSFTGLRIGVSTVKGLALALGIPVVAVPTLDALAARLPFAAHPVCPVLDARKGEVYACLYHWAEGTMVRDWEYLALAPEALCERILGPVILVGDALDALGDLFVARLGGRARLAPAGRRLPSAATVGALGHALLLAGQRVDPAALTPLYLRPSEAELRRRRALLVH